MTAGRWSSHIMPQDLWGPDPLTGQPAFTGAAMSSRSWAVDWSRYSSDEVERMFFGAIRSDIEFHTSGSTTEPVRWTRTPAQLWEEVGAIADLVEWRRPQALLSFAPSSHLYGAVVTATLAARLSTPMWYIAPGDTVIPMGQGKRWVVAAVPFTFQLLRRKPEWLEAARDVTMLHSTAMLPKTARVFLSGQHPERVRLVEVFGSTETGAVASRTWNGDEGQSWTLLPDVEFAEEHLSGEALLAVAGPRIANRPDGEPLRQWTMDDYIVRRGDREFCFEGRRNRLIKINGRRVDLASVERALRDEVPCRDIVCYAVRDAVRGETFDVHVVPSDGATFDDYAAVSVVTSRFDTVPRAVKVVDSAAWVGR